MADNATEVLRSFAQPQFHFDKTVVLEEAVEQPLQAVVTSSASLVRGAGISRRKAMDDPCCSCRCNTAIALKFAHTKQAVAG